MENGFISYLKGNEDIGILVKTAFLLALVAMLCLPLGSPLCPGFCPLGLHLGDLRLAGDQGLLLLNLRRRHPLSFLKDILEDVFSFGVIVAFLGLLLVHGKELGSCDCLLSKFFLREVLVSCFWNPAS